MKNSWAGKPDFNQQEQQIAFDCPQTPKCDRVKEYYSQLREYKQLPIMEKFDVGFNSFGVLFGYTKVIIIAVLVGALFAKEVIKYSVIISKFIMSKKFKIIVGDK